MEKIKSIITGVLSGTVFFMTMHVGVAQEKAAISVDNVEMKETVEAKVLAGTVQKVNAVLAKKKAEDIALVQEVMKEPIEVEVTKTEPRKSLYWFRVNTNGSFTHVDGPEEVPDCDEQIRLPGYIYCSVAFNTPEPPVSNIEDVEEDPGIAEDARYRPED